VPFTLTPINTLNEVGGASAAAVAIAGWVEPLEIVQEETDPAVVVASTQNHLVSVKGAVKSVKILDGMTPPTEPGWKLKVIVVELMEPVT
jgi:hypothetical protein